MTTKKRVFLTLTTAATLVSAAPERPAGGHPVVGKWQWTRSDNNCTEVYDYRADGTAPILSGAERTDNTFTVAAEPDANGFYKMTVRTTKDYGGKDCADDTTDSTGLESTTYILLSPNQQHLLNCYEAQRNACFGPLRRIK